ncbi:hypothetical protein KSP40_PGU009895 [Platanthera guangdongensis]|uniref:Uncharacterized protein n=1 Tax=Platanthera guangdongensis TaxID=2320717 RepID=A0ABR2MJ32_9ASPA
MMAAILNISAAALQVDDNASPLLFSAVFRALIDFITSPNDLSVQLETPREVTEFYALRPPKEPNPSMYVTPAAFLVAAAAAAAGKFRGWMTAILCLGEGCCGSNAWGLFDNPAPLRSGVNGTAKSCLPRSG